MRVLALFITGVAAISKDMITADEFDQLASGKKVFVELYAEWWHFCQDMHDDLEHLIQTYNSTEDILVASVQCEDLDGDGTGAALCDRLMNKCTNEPGYPTLCYGDYNSDDTYTEYVGDHGYSAMLEFVQQNLGPAADAMAVEESQPASPKKCFFSSVEQSFAV